MQFEPGMRVRCVRETPGCLTEGSEYMIDNVTGRYVWLVDDTGSRANWFGNRFKPVVRVKAKCVPSLSVMIKRSEAALAAMSPAEKEAMSMAQRESWARGEAELSKHERGMTRRSIPCAALGLK